ncbi:MAG: hypothetical protein EXR91_13075 [Gemmatimonadetes bacterium]|nr:hypothetical protein [Gemmatimonadota bacterium]
MYYRSDWPEVGLSGPLREGSQREPTGQGDDVAADWSDQSRVGGIDVRWTASRDRFESTLYDIPVWHLRLELDHVLSDALADPVQSGLTAALTSDVQRFLKSGAWGSAYVCSTVVKSEPLYQSLVDSGFTEVEERRVYRTPIRHLVERPWPALDGSLAITSLADFPQEQRASVTAQIFKVSAEAFGGTGHSRHFTDPVLTARRPGLDYIGAAMALNFERFSPAAFLVAVEHVSGCICGFSVVGRKPGLGAMMYTQLLSAARPAFQGRDIYLRITRRLLETLPADATLLNVTHAGNLPMQMAYQRSGRVHLADTTAMRIVHGASS